MKKRLLCLSLIFTSIFLNAAPFKNVPTYLTQPDGTKFECFISGDEFYHYLHNTDGYVIIKNPADGWFYYATRDINGEQIASGFIPGKDNPAYVGLKPHAFISDKALQVIYNQHELFKRKSAAKGGLFTGTINNIVIYIQFLDDSDFTNTRRNYDALFNSDTKRSLKNYYDEVTYGKLSVISWHFPVCEMNTNLACIDSHNRNYYEPYDASTNPNGYIGEQLYSRRNALLVNAIARVKTEIESTLTGDEIDINNDGVVDNVCFIIRGGNNDWADLLWSHMGSIGGQGVLISNKLVDNYTFQTESQTEAYVLCHEFFHTLGAPDLYHYSYDGLTPVGSWDLMESGYVHMGAWMKYKYGNQNWISDIPEITQDGTYTLKSLASSDSNCFKIKSRNTDSEFYVLEYRDASGKYESNVPGSGLLIYRIMPSSHGNAGGPPDEVYIYRPYGTTTHDGQIENAFYSYYNDRTEINDNTNPSGFLSDEKPGGLNISEIGEPGRTISFKISFKFTPSPQLLFAQVSGTTSVILNWEADENNDSVMVAYSSKSVKLTPDNNVDYQVGDALPNGGTIIFAGKDETTLTQNGLSPSTTYYYKIWSKHDGIYSAALNANATTYCDYVETIPYTESFNSKTLPTCWNIADNKKNGQTWEFTNIGDVEFNSFTQSDGFACINSGYYGLEQAQNTDLISPAFDFTSNTFVYLHFVHYLKVELNRTEANFMYSIDNGKTWNTLETWTSSTDNAELYSINLSELLAGKSNVRFKWNFEATADRFWCIDDFKILDKLLAVEDIKNKTSAPVSPYQNQVVTFAATVTKMHATSGNIFMQDSPRLWSGLPLALDVSNELWSSVKTGDSLIITALIKDESKIPYLMLPYIKDAGPAINQQKPVETKLTEIKGNAEAFKGLYLKCDSLTLEGWDDMWIFTDYPNSIWINNDDIGYSLKTGEKYNIAGIYYESGEQAYMVPLSDNDISEWVGIDGKEKLTSLKSYPNPFSDYINLELAGNATVKIVDFSGKLILKENFSNPGSCRIDTRQLLPGAYLIEVLDNNQRMVSKAIKSK
jgi:M6 family metalloprotease-like protein